MKMKTLLACVCCVLFCIYCSKPAQVAEVKQYAVDSLDGIITRTGVMIDKENSSESSSRRRRPPPSRDANKTFPFEFTSSPYNLGLTVSLPLFDRFGREQRLQEAQIARDNASYDVRRQELQLTADVTSAWTSLQAAYRTVGLQEQNAAAAQEALTLAQARYRVGASTFVKLVQSRNEYERASTDRIGANYDYHRAWAALESAVGRPLR